MLRRNVAKRCPDGVKQSSVSRKPRIVGEIRVEDTDDDYLVAVYWKEPYSLPIILKINDGDGDSIARDINDYNIIVGNVRSSEQNKTIAVYWDNINNTYKSLRDVSSNNSITYYANGINNNNTVVGRVMFINSQTRPCFWYSLDGSLNLLSITVDGDNTGYNYGEATDINNNGHIVGYLRVFTIGQGFSNEIPVYWDTPTSNPVKLQLNYAGYTHSISDNGNIYGRNKSVNWFKWTSYTDTAIEITTAPYINKINNKSNIISIDNTYYDSPASSEIRLSLNVNGINYTDGTAHGITN
jgi:hypothetical protein